MKVQDVKKEIYQVEMLPLKRHSGFLKWASECGHITLIILWVPARKCLHALLFKCLKCTSLEHLYSQST